MHLPVEAEAAVRALNRCAEDSHEWVLMRNAAREEYRRCTRCAMLIWI